MFWRPIKLFDRRSWFIICRDFSTKIKPKAKNQTLTINKSREPVRLVDYLLFIAPLTTLGLGTWQFKRYQWKQGLKKEMRDQLDKEPVPLPEDLRKLDEMEYQKVWIKGRFDHSKEQYIGPRVLNREDSVAVPSMLASNSNGFWVVTPFKLSDRDYSILVNRGWVPKDRLPPQNRLNGQVTDEITLTGIVRKSEVFTGPARESNGVWLRRDIKKLAQAVNAAPVMIDIDEKSSIKGGPVGGQTRVQLVDNHMSYMITWYILTVIMTYLCIKRIVKKKNPLLV